MISIFSLKNPVDLHFGAGAVKNLSNCKIGKKALIVTGRSSARKHGILDKVVNNLRKAGISSIPFEEVIPNPLSTTVSKGVEIAKENGCDIIVGLGGGSAMDTAKAIALMAVNPGEITDYQPGGKYADDDEPEKCLPIIAITTTAGTGSEINRYLVISNVETNEKPGIGFEVTYPTIAIVDPQLMLTVPANITTDTGVDVLFHALEAFVGKDANMYTDLIAGEAIKLTINNLKPVINNGQDLEARGKIAWANTLAGLAIDIAGTVAIHGAGHPLSGRYNLTHAQTLAVLGVSYLKNNYHANPEKFAQLTDLLGYKTEGLTINEKAAKSPEALKAFLSTVKRDFRISDLVDLTDLEIETLSKDAFKTMAGAIENNPRNLTLDDIKKLYTDSL